LKYGAIVQQSLKAAALLLPAGPVRSGPVGCLKCTNGKFSLANPGREVIIIPAKTHSCCAARATSQSRIGEW